jgi:hypothetical protein
MSVRYLYEQIVLKGALKGMLIAPAVRNTLDDRVAIALRSLQFTDTHTPADFKEQMKEEFDTVNAVYGREIGKANQSPALKPIEAKIRSLKQTEKRAVLTAYLKIAVETIKRYGAEEECRKHPRTKATQ